MDVSGGGADVARGEEGAGRSSLVERMIGPYVMRVVLEKLGGGSWNARQTCWRGGWGEGHQGVVSFKHNRRKGNCPVGV